MKASLIALVIGISLFQTCASWGTYGKYDGHKGSDYHPSYTSYDQNEDYPKRYHNYERDYINHYRDSKSKNSYYDDEKLWVQNLNENRNDNQDDTRSENELRNKNINLNDLLVLIEKLKHGGYQSYY